MTGEDNVSRLVSLFRLLTLLDARRDGDEGHEAAEAQVDPQQCLVEVAGDGVRVVLVHEGEGHGGDGVEEEGGAHHGQVPALVLGGSSQPAGGDTHAFALGFCIGREPSLFLQPAFPRPTFLLLYHVPFVCVGSIT